MLPAALALRRKVDWREYGAAPVLGVNGVVLIAHGRSDAKAIYGAIRSTRAAVEGKVVQAIQAGLARSPAPSSVPSAQPQAAETRLAE